MQSSPGMNVFVLSHVVSCCIMLATYRAYKSLLTTCKDKTFFGDGGCIRLDKNINDYMVANFNIFKDSTVASIELPLNCLKQKPCLFSASDGGGLMASLFITLLELLSGT